MRTAPPLEHWILVRERDVGLVGGPRAADTDDPGRSNNDEVSTARSGFASPGYVCINTAVRLRRLVLVEATRRRPPLCAVRSDLSDRRFEFRLASECVPA